MNGTFLKRIVEKKRVRVAAAKRATATDALAERADGQRSGREPHRFFDAIRDRSRPNIIAEFKRSSPSRGSINDLLDPATAVKQYGRGGAAAVSILTEEDHFRGSIEDLQAARSETDLPILRKDFIFDEYQIYESAAAGCDAILLIVAIVSVVELVNFHDLALSLGLDAIVEVHDAFEMEAASKIDARIIGVNNRNLTTFDVSLDVSRELIQQAPATSVMIAESGLQTRDDVAGLFQLGYSGFLIGEALMRSGDPESEIKKMMGCKIND